LLQRAMESWSKERVAVEEKEGHLIRKIRSE